MDYSIELIVLHMETLDARKIYVKQQLASPKSVARVSLCHNSIANQSHTNIGEI